MLPLTAKFIWLQHHKVIVRREVKSNLIAGLEKENLVLLQFTSKEAKTQLRWEHDKEFEYKHQMFDIVETEVHGDTTNYWCWPDNEETQLNQQLDKLLANALGNDSQIQDTKKQLTDFFKSLYHQESGETFLIFSQVFQQNFQNKLSYTSHSLSPPVPPP